MTEKNTYVSEHCNRAFVPGWVEIGRRCSAGRRSLWLRVNLRPGAVRNDDAEDVESFELCAGREGDDAYARVTPDNPQFAELLDVVTTARFAAET